MKLFFKCLQPEAGNAATFIFRPQEPLDWIAGQSIKIELPGEYGPLDHRFTISSAPYEKHVAITTRPSDSEYKKSLFALKPGDEANGFTIEGDFTWRDTELPHIFVAAGIGITPFRSILQQRAHDNQPLPATLIYGSPTNDIIYKEQLDTWAYEHPELQVRYIMGERVRAAHIETLASYNKSLVYISGPSIMVDELSEALQNELDVSKVRLVRDWFTGRLPQDG